MLCALEGRAKRLSGTTSAHLGHNKMFVLHPTFRHNFLMLKISHQRIMTVRKCRTTGYPGSWSDGEMSSNGPVPSGGTTWSGKSNKWRTVAQTSQGPIANDDFRDGAHRRFG